MLERDDTSDVLKSHQEHVDQEMDKLNTYWENVLYEKRKTALKREQELLMQLQQIRETRNKEMLKNESEKERAKKQIAELQKQVEQRKETPQENKCSNCEKVKEYKRRSDLYLAAKSKKENSENSSVQESQLSSPSSPQITNASEISTPQQVINAKKSSTSKLISSFLADEPDSEVEI